MTYYGKIKRFWDELKNMRSIPSCNCGAMSKCNCEFFKRIADFESEVRSMQFLLGLNNGFDNAISNIMSMDPMPSMNRAFYLVQQVDKQMK